MATNINEDANFIQPQITHWDPGVLTTDGTGTGDYILTLPANNAVGQATWQWTVPTTSGNLYEIVWDRVKKIKDFVRIGILTSGNYVATDVRIQESRLSEKAIRKLIKKRILVEVAEEAPQQTNQSGNSGWLANSAVGFNAMTTSVTNWNPLA